MSRFRILLTHPDIPKSGLNILKPFCDLITLNSKDVKELDEKVANIDGVMVFGGFKVDKSFVEKAKGLKVVATMGVGYDSIDVNYLKSVGIKVSNTSGSLDNCVAEVAIALALSAGHRMKEGFELMKKGEWKKGEPQWLLGQEINGSVFGIIGLGNIGKLIAKAALVFGPDKIIYTGNSPKSYDQELNAQFASLDVLLSESDFIILSCPLTEKTKHIINKKTLGLMKNNAIIVNIARGDIIQQDDLYLALKNNQIMAAGLDVTTPEPIDKNHPLLSLDNCIISPHIGSATLRTRSRMSDIAATNILAALHGKKMPNEL